MSSVLKAIAGNRLSGRLRYLMRPREARAWGGPFNGQAGRCLLFAQLVDRLAPACIVETGTFRGTTTEWMSAFQIPVFTVEAQDDHFGFSRARLGHIANVHLEQGDSRAFLRTLLAGPLAARTTEASLVYLDAHWKDDLPLAEELDIVFSALPRAVVMIDDFAVPDEPQYGYDDYGPGKALVADYIAPAVQRFGLGVYYPSLPASEETGSRRGCVVLARRQDYPDLSGRVPRLRPARLSAG